MKADLKTGWKHFDPSSAKVGDPNLVMTIPAQLLDPFESFDIFSYHLKS